MKLAIKTQPDDVTCGATSLYALYCYYHDAITLDQVIQQVEHIDTGGTLAALLGKHALNRGYDATLYVYNLDFFDPTWFYPKKLLPAQLIDKLVAQLHYKNSNRFHETSQAYIDFIKLGGQIHFNHLTVSLLKKYFYQKIPVLTALSATYLYQSARERLHEGQLIEDDLQGEPIGHFVILSGYDDKKRRIIVADPHRGNPFSGDNYYRVSSTRLINAIMLGVLTYDANLLVIEPKKRSK